MGKDSTNTRGYRVRAHAAETVLEAWAPTKDECVAEAVHALVDSFADTDEARPDGSVALAVDNPTDEDLLVTVLEEVRYQAKKHGVVAIDVSIDERTGATEGRVDVRFATIPAAKAAFVGAVPKAVSLRALTFNRHTDTWRCRITVDP